MRLLGMPGAEVWLDTARLDPVESAQKFSTVGNIYLRAGLASDAEVVFDTGADLGLFLSKYQRSASPSLIRQALFLDAWLGTHASTMSRDVPDIHWDRADFVQGR